MPAKTVTLPDLCRLLRRQALVSVTAVPSRAVLGAIAGCCCGMLGRAGTVAEGGGFGGAIAATGSQQWLLEVMVGAIVFYDKAAHPASAFESREIPVSCRKRSSFRALCRPAPSFHVVTSAHVSAICDSFSAAAVHRCDQEVRRTRAGVAFEQPQILDHAFQYGARQHPGPH